jgi:hypothetical protein
MSEGVGVSSETGKEYSLTDRPRYQTQINSMVKEISSTVNNYSARQ